MLMDCTQCIKELTAFLDGELPPADSDRIRSHLSTCSSCAEEMRTLQQTTHFVRSHQRELEVNPAIWHQVRARISAPQESFRLWRFPAIRLWRPFAVATAVIAVTIAMGTLQYRQAQRRNLEHYMQQYIQTREIHKPDPPVFVDSGMNPQNEATRPFNPFADFEEALTDNPFRLEEP